jgi:hypothetical protein
MKLLHAVLLAVSLLVAPTAHAGKMAKVKTPLVVSADKATIVFMRPGKFVGAAVALPVFDVTSEQTQFVGLVEAGSKVAYQVSAGQHQFMTTVFGGDKGVRFYSVNVEAGKTYYFYAHIIDGVWGLEPLRTGNTELEGFDKATTLTENSPKTLAWAEDHKDSVAEKRALKPATIADENSLRVEDGR